MTRWEQEIPEDVAAIVMRRGTSPEEDYAELRAGTAVVTSLKEIRRLARGYSARHRVPIKISARAFSQAPGAHGFFCYDYDRHGDVKATVYLHPVLQYYPVSYIRGIIEHELDHLKVERKWSKL